MKSKRGITLVSLVVTIIVLIILAGVSINLTIGENGIITVAKKARENMELAQIEEERQLNDLYDQIQLEDIGTGSSDYDLASKFIEFKQKVASAITDMGIDTLETANADTMASNIRNISRDASSINYDNSNSGLLSTNVQNAVDEVNENIENNKFKNLDYSKNVSLGIEFGNGNFTAPTDGFIIGYVGSYLNNTGEININGKLITRWKTGSSEGQWNYFPISIPIRKNDVFTMSVSNEDTSFFTFSLNFYSI